jgi:glycine/D-amino acid oxidase-like deaminating enzyme
MKPVCIVGAGVSGLAAAKALQDRGIRFEIFERNQVIGGMWNYGAPGSALYNSVRLISSKPLTQFRDHPIPAALQDYLGHREALDYVRSYADRFGITGRVRLGIAVERAGHVEGGWMVRLSDAREAEHSALIVASGFHHRPRMPRIQGTFSGETLHALEYRRPEVFRGRRVLIVGGGNSGCDIAAEAAEYAEAAFHSLRRGYYFIPRYLFGRPADQVGELSLRLRVPLSIRRRINTLLLRRVVGKAADYGLPEPDHKLFEAHPIVNGRILQYYKTRRLRVKPDVQAFHNHEVEFRDGSRERIDLVLFATGYVPSIPYLEPDELNLGRYGPDLQLHVFHPERPNLFVLGMIQPDSGVWWLIEYQAKLVAAYLDAVAQGRDSVTRFRDYLDSVILGSSYIDSPRHFCEVEHFAYQQALKSGLAILNKA